MKKIITLLCLFFSLNLSFGQCPQANSQAQNVFTDWQTADSWQAMQGCIEDECAGMPAGFYGANVTPLPNYVGITKINFELTSQSASVRATIVNDACADVVASKCLSYPLDSVLFVGNGNFTVFLSNTNSVATVKWIATPLQAGNILFTPYPCSAPLSIEDPKTKPFKYQKFDVFSGKLSTPTDHPSEGLNLRSDGQKVFYPPNNR